MKYQYRNVTDVFLSRLRELVCDNKGAALAITLAFVMPVYLMVIGIYGIGEMIRNKIELQNAADAAAYSAAAVQADYLSRMATVNKAMAWTYVDLQKRSLDLAMALFTVHVFAKFESDSNMVQRKNLPCHMHVPGVHYCCGTTVAAPDGTLKFLGTGIGIPQVAESFNGQNFLGRMLLSHLAVEVAAEISGKGAVANGIKVLGYSKNLLSMMSRLNTLVKEYPEKIRKTALQVAVANMAECKDDYIIHIKTGDLPSLSLIPTADNEKTFISWADPDLKEYEPEKVFGPGTDDWIVRKKIPLGFLRVYKQTKQHLYAKWQWFWTKWVHIDIPIPTGGLHLPPVTPTGDYGKGEREYFGYSLPEIARDMPIGLLVAPAIPLTLRPDYFGKAGTITVAVARKTSNPFSVFNPWGSAVLLHPESLLLSIPVLPEGTGLNICVPLLRQEPGTRPGRKIRRKNWKVLLTALVILMLPGKNPGILLKRTGMQSCFRSAMPGIYVSAQGICRHLQ